MAAPRFFIARHGETVFNVSGRWQGQGDSPLTARGLAQARELGRALAHEPITAVYSSDLGRAAQTAQAVAEGHALDVWLEPRLREIDVGRWTGKSGEEIEAEYPGARRTWADAPSSMRLPQGEPLLEAGIGQTILVHALGGSVDELWLEQRVDNCQISRLEWTVADGLKLIELADVRHLAQVGSLRSWRTDPA